MDSLYAPLAAGPSHLSRHDAALSRLNHLLSHHSVGEKSVSACLTLALDLLAEARHANAPEPADPGLLDKATAILRRLSAASGGSAPPIVASAPSDIAALRGLTDRQRQIMERVLDGQPSKNIAADLNISQRTVESHRAAIMHRTGATSLPALARIVAGAPRREDCRADAARSGFDLVGVGQARLG